MDALTLVVMVIAALLLGVALTSLVTHWRATPEQRRALRLARRIRLTWHRTALRTGLFQADHGAKTGADVPMRGELRRAGAERILIPSIKVRPAPHGLAIDVKTVGRLGLPAFEKAADDLANAWRVRFVEAAPAKPGHVTLRVTLDDALRTRTAHTPHNDPARVNLLSWTLGTGRDGRPVTVRTKDVSGIAVGGLSGYGKTNLVLHRVTTLAPSPHVQFALIDGKDFELEDLAPRAWLHAGDDTAAAHTVVSELYALFIDRKNAIRQVLGRRNFWAAPSPATPAWPLAVLVIDEAHTFLNESKFPDPDSKHRDTLVREIIRMVDELVRKGRTLGIQVMLLTQKPTGEAIPTKIRDNCQIAMSFAQRSTEAAVAALGEDIRDYPHAHPRRLQDPAYVGVVSVVADGRPGYTLARIPHTADRDAADLARATAHLVRDPRQTLRELLNAPAPADDLQDAAV